LRGICDRKTAGHYAGISRQIKRMIMMVKLKIIYVYGAGGHGKVVADGST
jgi:hypothetical protein